ncbi:MAG: hypothetical protein HY219_00140 [Candidatus Staskawiczbacteria bacterium]|nr:hypothetical protein [Candidatus Staskawiczbacteria bacterium]
MKRLEVLEFENKKLSLENVQLKERLNSNSSNSSLPPSKSLKKSKNKRISSGKTSGGQQGHKGYSRQLLASDQVSAIEHCQLPSKCTCGGKIKPSKDYQRHQVHELPTLSLQVTEYQLQKGYCEACGQKHIAALPSGVTWGITGPRLTAFMSELVAKYGLSRREQKAFLQEHFQFKISLGTVFNKQKIVANITKSTQAYYTAESGIEDSLLRLNNNPQMSPLSYSINIDNTTANVVIPGIIGGSRAIISQGNLGSIIRTIQAVYGIDSQNVSFYYGVAVGEGGLQMNNGSEIKGNVFSNGNITGSGTIENNVVVSGNGHSIQGVYVKGDALSYSCLSPASVNNLTYVTGGSHTCAVRGTTSVQSQEISQQPLPISQSQIDDWKSETANASTITGNFTIANNQTQSLGPVKITGDLTISNGATLNITGTVYVVGNIITSSNSKIKLDSSYGSLGGILLSDGIINISNGNTFSGSGQAGSYVLALSTNTSDSAISVNNNATGVVLYTNVGGVSIANNVSVVEVTGYKVILANNAEVEYSSGVANIFFSNGPGGGWKIISWEEK